MQPGTDEIREFVEDNFLLFDEATQEAVEELYPEPSVFAQFLDQSAARFQFATNASFAGFAAPVGEPASAAVGRFEAGVTREELAGILGISQDLLLANLGRLPQQFQVLINPNARLDRRVIDVNIANIICILNLGITNDPACGVVDDDGV
jgi:hypothetical protein